MTQKDHSFYLEGTNGKGIILVHGLTGAPAEMKFVGKQLNKMGYTVYAPLLAGHCVDEATLVATNYRDWLDSLKKAVNSFAPKVSEVHMAGICVGGGLALYAAHEMPDKIKSVTIYSATLNYDGWNQPKWSRLAQTFKEVLIHIPKVRHSSFGESHPFGLKSDRLRNAIVKGGDGIEGTLARFPTSSLYENYRLNDILKKALPKMKVPTLLIHAREDDVSHPRNAEKIKKLHGGRCEIIYLDDSYHLIHIDKEHKKVAQMTADFIESTGKKALKHG